jgi:Phycobilisome protein
MLTKLKRLSIDVDSRYATDQELQFLQDYLDSATARIDLYEKLADQHQALDQQIEDTIQTIDPNIYRRGDQDVSAICKRDRQHAFYCLAIAMLLNDLEHLKDDYLLWDQKIVRAFRDQRSVKITYQILTKILENCLNDPEKALIMPAVSLAQATLAN